MSQNKARPTIAFLLSLSIHVLLAGGILYLGLDLALPEGTVSSTEVEIVSGPVPEGNQNQDSTQVETTVAKTVKPKPKTKAPPPPPPPPKPEEPAEEEPLLSDDADDFAMPEKEEVEREAKPLNEYAKQEREREKDPLEKFFEEDSAVDTESDVYQEQSEEKELFQEELAEEDYEFPEAEEEQEGNAYQNENAYGISGGVRSHEELTPIPGNVPPEYPMMARLRKYEGSAVLQFEVLSDGSVANVQLIRSSGYDLLDKSAIKAHKKWRYRRGKTGEFIKTYTFSLKGKAQEAPTQLRRGN